MKKTYYKDPNIGFQLSPFDNAVNEPVRQPLPDDWEKRDEDFEDEGAPDDDDMFI